MDSLFGQVELPSYSINGGLDRKFEEEEMPDILSSIMEEDEYAHLMRGLNTQLEKHRHKKKDMACLAAGVTLLPLAPFLYRHAKHKKRSKKVMQDICRFWNEQHKECELKWKFDRDLGTIFVGRSRKSKNRAVQDAALNQTVRRESAPPGSIGVIVEVQEPQRRHSAPILLDESSQASTAVGVLGLPVDSPFDTFDMKPPAPPAHKRSQSADMNSPKDTTVGQGRQRTSTDDFNLLFDSWVARPEGGQGNDLRLLAAARRKSEIPPTKSGPF